MQIVLRYLKSNGATVRPIRFLGRACRSDSDVTLQASQSEPHHGWTEQYHSSEAFYFQLRFPMLVPDMLDQRDWLLFCRDTLYWDFALVILARVSDMYLWRAAYLGSF